MASTRATLHRIAAHVLGRRRYEVTGRFGLRAGPGGIATPAFGPEPEVVRISGGALLHEQGGAASAVRIAGRSLRELADFAGTDIESEFSVGTDTPDRGDLDKPLNLDGDAVSLLAVWWNLGTIVLDSVLAGLPEGSDPATIQLWPEHFDVATVCTVGPGAKVNLGFSPGDSYHESPYLYVGPWDDARPIDPVYWNAPFGALLAADVVLEVDDPFGAARGFIGKGLGYLGGDLAPVG